MDDLTKHTDHPYFIKGCRDLDQDDEGVYRGTIINLVTGERGTVKFEYSGGESPEGRERYARWRAGMAGGWKQIGPTEAARMLHEHVKDMQDRIRKIAKGDARSELQRLLALYQDA